MSLNLIHSYGIPPVNMNNFEHIRLCSADHMFGLKFFFNQGETIWWFDSEVVRDLVLKKINNWSHEVSASVEEVSEASAIKQCKQKLL